MLVDRDRDSMGKVLQELREIYFDRCDAVIGDVAEAEEVEAAIRKCEKRFGRIDILLHSAGIYPTFPSLLDTPDDEWDKVIHVNLRSTFLICKRVLPRLIRAGGGTIVNLSSISGIRGTTYSVPYAVAKAGIIHLTKTIAVQYASKGIRANCIVPGLVDSPMSRKVTGTAEEFSRFIQQIPAGRAGTPDDIAKLACFLASSDSSYINGAAIVIDGGIMAK